VEYALTAADSTGLTAVAVRGKSSCALVIQKKVPVSLYAFLVPILNLVVSQYSSRLRFFVTLQDRLIDPSSVTYVYKITDNIGCLMAGLTGEHQQSQHTCSFIVIAKPMLGYLKPL
jgi:20S proteasome subunit alpha 1